MRLLMTTDTVGGVWTFTKELAGGLLAQGCHIVLVSFGRAPSADQHQDADQLTRQGNFRYVPIDGPLEWMPDNAAAYSAAEPLLLQLCHEFKPNALLLSQFCFGALPLRATKIVIAHSDVLGWAEATAKAPLKNDAWLQTYYQLVQAGLDGADALVAPTRAALNSMPVHYKLPYRTAVIPNGRSIAAGSPGEPRHLRAITAGRMWDPAKNLALLREVALPLPMLIVGQSDDVATPTSDGLIHLGQKSERELLTYFRQSAIYICCSLYEPFGLAPLEAALCGCAVIAYDIPSLRDVWGNAALYFNDANGLNLLLRRLVNEPEQLVEAQRRSKTRAQSYTTDRMTDGYLQLLTSLCAAKAGDQACAA